MKDQIIAETEANIKNLGQFGNSRDPSLVAEQIIESLRKLLKEYPSELGVVTELAQNAIENASSRHLIADGRAEVIDADRAMSNLVRFINDNNLQVRHYMVTASKNVVFNRVMDTSRMAFKHIM